MGMARRALQQADPAADAEPSTAALRAAFP
jgi:hypothetical protein